MSFQFICRQNWFRWWLIIPIIAFVTGRFPILIHEPGGQDEQWFCVPGFTLSQEGIPRIPYLPNVSRETFFEGADRCLMALPPGLFIAQVPGFWIFEPGYPVGRIPCFLGALGLLVATVRFVHYLSGSGLYAFFSGMLLALSRPLLFTGLIARPDCLCILFGTLAVFTLWEELAKEKNDEFSIRRSLMVGLLLGLSGLCHPFAMVFAIQIGVGWCLIRTTVREKLIQMGLLGAGCLVVLGFWLPWIIGFPEEFKSQFFSNVLDRAGPGIGTRLLWPFPYFVHHSKLVFEYLGPWQTSVLVMMSSFALLRFAYWSFAYVSRWKSSGRQSRHEKIWAILLLTSLYLTASVAGLHPTKGYWLYPWTMALVGTPFMMNLVRSTWILFAPHQRSGLTSHKYHIAGGVVGLAMIMAITLPGGGFALAANYWKNWGQTSHHATKFIRSEIAKLPDDAIFLVDFGYVFDFYLTGRKVYLADLWIANRGDWPANYHYLVLTRQSDAKDWSAPYGAGEPVRISQSDDPFACWFWLYKNESTKVDGAL